MDEHTPLYTSDLPGAEALIVRKQNARAPSRGAIATLAGFSASLLVAGAYFASSSGSFVGGTFESRHRLGDEPPHSAIAVDQIVGPLTADVRNAARLGQLKTSELATPECAKTCCLDGLEGVLDSSFCVAFGEESVTECIDTECDASQRSEYDALVADLCPDGIGYEVHVASVDSDTNEDVEPDFEEKTGKLGGAPNAVSELGRHQAGPNSIAEDAAPNLVTWQCDFGACDAMHPTDLGGIGQYVDDTCTATGGIGCEGAEGGETRCRACYLVQPQAMGFPGNLGYPRCPMCVCKALGKQPNDCILCSGFYKFFKIEVLRVIGGWNGDPTKSHNGCMQFGELKMYDMHGALIPVDVDSSENPGGNNPMGALPGQTPYHQGPYAAVDGTLEKKFLDLNFYANQNAPLIFAVQGDPVMIRGYEFFTGDDHPTRDPVEWKVSGADSKDGPWYEFSHISDANPPIQRYMSYGVIDPCESN